MEAREAQRLRDIHLANWRNWPANELSDYRAFWRCNPDAHLRVTPRIVLGYCLMVAAVVVATMIGFFIDKEIRSETIATLRRIKRWEIWKRS